MRAPPVPRPLAAALLLAGTGPAAAQVRPVAPPPPPATSRPAAAAPLPSAAPPSAAAAPAPAPDPTDGESVIGSWGLAIFNPKTFTFRNVVGAAPISVYTVGFRHWMPQPAGPFKHWGVDLGAGLVLGRGKDKAPVAGQLTTTDQPSATGFGFHGGLPLALAHARHVNFELVPEADLVFASTAVPQANGQKTEASAWSLRLGARAGFELFFGFMGVPQLALEATLAAGFSYDSQKATTGPVEISSTAWQFSTGRQNEPWSIFTGTVAALYYF